MRPTLLCDVDGVLADFTSAALELVYQITGRRYRSSQLTTWEIFDSIPEKDVEKEVYGILKGKGGCTGLPVIDGAKEGIARLRERADIIIVTSPFSGSETWAYERTRWLENHFQVKAEDIVFAKNKARIHGDFFLDDKPEHVVEWIDYWLKHEGSGAWTPAAGRAFLWSTDRAIDAPANLLRVRSWGEVYNLLE